MYASSLEKYNECLEAFEQYKTVQNYKNFYHHIESEYLNRPENKNGHCMQEHQCPLMATTQIIMLRATSRL